MSLILYPKNEKLFDNNGIGILSDATDAEVYEVLNGQFELTVKYPVSGIHFAEIVKNAIITANPDPVSDPQPFEIYRITKPMNKEVTIYARHAAYKLRKITVSPFSAENAPAALQGLKNNAVNDCPFEFWTDKSTAGGFTVKVPTAAWTLMGNSEGSILDTYGGEYEFDKWTVKLHNRRGADRGVSIRYGKNLTSLEQDENCANVYTGVYPYWADMDGNVVMLPEKVVMIADEYEDELIMPLDLSQSFETAPTEEQLRAKTQSYIKANDIGTPDVSWTVEFVQLEQTEEYKGKALLERVLLGDTVAVIFPKLGVDVLARAVAVRYKPLLERYKSVSLGKVKANIADTIVQQSQKISQKPSASLVQSMIVTLTATILGARGGAVRLLDTDGDGLQDTLYIGDKADPALATKVWRFNYEGWAASKTGYNGPFIMGATLEDGLLAASVTAANLVAGTIKSKDGKTFFLDLDNGILKMQATEFAISGKTVEQIAQEKLDNYAAEVSKDIENLQNQIDGNITSWFGDYVPTTSNEPASNWTTEDLKSQHLGDLFYINEGAEQGGMVYRWALVNGTYQWVIVEDTDVAKALAAAAAAKDTADSKRRVFVVQPAPPYDVGDLWAQGSGGDLMRCKTSRASGSYAAADWELASKYIDAASAGTIAKEKVDAQTHTDIFNKWTDGGKIQGIYSANGKWYINAEIAQIVNLIAQKLTSVKDDFTLNIDGAQMALQNRFGETFSVCNADDLAYMYFRAFDTNGNDIGRSQFGANRIFLGGTWANPAFRVETGYLPDGTTTSKMTIDRINPGKKQLWTGTCAVGATITVPNTSDYDLFAIRLGDDGGTYTQSVLAYKSGNEISGVGGWSGTASKSKDLQFVTFTANGNSWHLEDCEYHYVYSDGSLSARTRVNVREIYGVI